MKGIISFLNIVGGIIFLAILYWIKSYNYVVFHSIAELFSVLVALSIFILVVNLQRFISDSFLSILGISFFFVAIIDFLHALTYKGMDIFPLGFVASANLPTQLWIAARYFQAISLLVATVFIGKKIKEWPIFVYCGIIFSLLFLSIFYWHNFPAAFIEGTGLTDFKVYSEYLISLLFIISAIAFYKNRSKLDSSSVFRLFIIFIIVTVASEISFTLYKQDVYGFFNLLGHYLKIVAFYLVYLAVVKITLVRPYDSIFKDIKKSEKLFKEERDQMKIYFNKIGVMIVVLDRDGRVIFLNEAACHKIGCRVESVVNNDWFDTFVPANARAELKDYFKKIINGKIAMPDYHENLVLTVTGEEILIGWHNVALKDSRGECIATISSGENVGEVRKLANDLQRRTIELEQLNKLMVGRELKMIELKKEIEVLKKRRVAD